LSSPWTLIPMSCPTCSANLPFRR